MDAGTIMAALLLLGANGFAIKWLKGISDRQQKEIRNLYNKLEEHNTIMLQSYVTKSEVKDTMNDIKDRLKELKSENKDSIKALEAKIDTLISKVK